MLSERAATSSWPACRAHQEPLEESGIEGATIKRRVKSIYGIYRKTIMQNKSFDEIYDIYAVRIILDTLAECYSTLGLIHDMYHPLPNRFKDYISTPKPNGYQSLHTTVIGHEGIPFEVQIRTPHHGRAGRVRRCPPTGSIRRASRATISWMSGWPGSASCWKTSASARIPATCSTI